MKFSFILCAIFIALAATASGQDSKLTPKQVRSVQKVIHTFQTKSKARIASLVSYPLRREYPLKDVKNKDEFVQRFDEIFDASFLDHAAKAKVNDWSEVGWRGIMFDNGKIWMDDDGKIMTVNYRSPKEEKLLKAAIQADKNQLPGSLRNFVRPRYLIVTKNYKIRIDEKTEGSYRYAAWKIKSQEKEPDIVIENGVWEFQGSGGNHTVTFSNNGFDYIVSVFIIGGDDTPEATLEVSKDAKTLLTENGRIIRN